VVAEYHDGFESAKPGKVRPTFEKLLAAARRREFEAVLVHKLDRFARDDYEHVVAEREMEKLGIHLESVSEPLDPSSPAGYLSRRIMQVISSWYIKNLAAEAKKGMRQKVEKGGWSRLAPTGYLNRREKNRAWVEVDPVMGPLMTKAFEEMSSGKWTLVSWAQHAAALGYRTRKGQPLTKSAWHRIFHNRFYIGKTRWDPTEERDGDHPPLTDKETFQRVQDVLAAHNRRRQQVRRHSYLLRGLLYSLDANSLCSGTTQVAKGQAYYRSVARVNGRQVYYNSREIDGQVEEIVKGLEIDPEVKESTQKALREWLEKMAAGGEDSDLDRARSRLEQLQKKRKNLNRMAAEDLVSWEDFKELRAEIDSEEASLNARIQMVLQHQALLSADFELALDIACNLGWLYGKGSFDERRLLVETLFKRVDAQGDKVVAYELNPPFTMFCPGHGRNENGPDGDPSGPVRVLSTLVGQLGIEPRTPVLSGLCSDRLSYWPNTSSTLAGED
jgi:site-specific DNA recombinase